MSVLDYIIIAVVCLLFILAYKAYKKKPHCSCSCKTGCSGNGSNCRKIN